MEVEVDVVLNRVAAGRMWGSFVPDCLVGLSTFRLLKEGISTVFS